MNHQMFIASYRKDFPWLEANLKSQRKFCRGFLPPVICVEDHEVFEVKKLIARSFPSAQVVIKNSHGRGLGFMRAQISMMSCDVLCPDADVSYLVGSDCLFWSTVTPENYYHQGKPLMLYNAREEFANYPPVLAWLNSTGVILGWDVNFEHMRRLPIPYPKQLFAPMRAHISARHGVPFEQYIYRLGHERAAVSESNIMGAFAREKMPELYTWMHAGTAEYDSYIAAKPNPMIQFWSHGGMDRPHGGAQIYSHGSSHGKSPNQIIREVLGC